MRVFLSASSTDPREWQERSDIRHRALPHGSALSGVVYEPMCRERNDRIPSSGRRADAALLGTAHNYLNCSMKRLRI